MKHMKIKFISSFRSFILLMSVVAVQLFAGCSSYDSFQRTTTGMSLGAIFGSTIGGIIGGYRGSDIGTLVGGATGAVLGAASAESARNEVESRTTSSSYNSHPINSYNSHDISYGRYSSYRNTVATPSQLDISHIVFSDTNGDRMLKAGEQAEITFDIYNRGTTFVYNVAPIVSCDYNRIKISPPAIIGEIPPGQGVRYHASVLAQSNARHRTVTFNIAFPDGSRHLIAVKSFPIQVIK